MERANFRVTHYLNWSPLARRLLTLVLANVGQRWVEFFMARSVVAHGFENFQKADPQRSVLLVVNHRTFNDQFTICARLFKMFGAHHNIFFPVRANYFYDNPAGLLVNMVLAQGVMYPPIIRQGARRRWNQTATDIMVELLKHPQNMVGVHPEGRRNQRPSPYDLLPAQPGCGELIYRANPNVIPVFLQGFADNVFDMHRNSVSRDPDRKPLVHMVMGEPLDFSKEREMEQNRKTYLHISQRVMARIGELSVQEKEIRRSQS